VRKYAVCMFYRQDVRTIQKDWQNAGVIEAQLVPIEMRERQMLRSRAIIYATKRRKACHPVAEICGPLDEKLSLCAAFDNK